MTWSLKETHCIGHSQIKHIRLVSSYYDWQVACVGIKLPIVLKHKKNIAESTIIASVTAMATPIMCDDLS